MHISVKWFGEQFNVNLHSKEGVEEFLSVKGCRIKDHNGKEFVAFPSTKNEKTDKWWNHVWGNDAFQAAVIETARKAKPEQKPESKPGNFDHMKDDIPF